MFKSLRLSNLKNSVSPKTFGDQAIKLAAAKAIQAATQSTLAKLFELQEQKLIPLTYKLSNKFINISYDENKYIIRY